MSKKSAITKYLSDIGRKGGQKSRRSLDPEAARQMQEASVKARQLRKAKEKK